MFITIIIGSLNALLWIKVGELPYHMYTYPAFLFSRAVYNCSTACADSVCYSKFSDIDNETLKMIILQYVVGAIYILLGTYLHEIIK